MSETQAIATTTETATPNAATVQATAPEPKKGKPVEAQQQLPPDKLGHQLAAERRLNKKLEQRQREIEAKEHAAREVISKAEEYSKLPAAEIVKREAQRRGVDPSVLIREAIGELTGQQKPQVKIDEKTDPNVAALAKQNEELAAELKKMRQEREDERKFIEETEKKRKAEATMGEITRAQGEAVKAALGAETDPILKNLYDEKTLDRAVFERVRQACFEYYEQYKTQPSDADVLQAVKDAPKLVLLEEKSSERYKRLSELVTKPEPTKSPMSLARENRKQLQRKPNDEPPPQLSSKLNNRARLQKAKESIPEGASFLGYAPK